VLQSTRPTIRVGDEAPRGNQARSKRSRLITLVHAATKPFTNFSFDRVVFGIPSEARDKVLLLLDKGAELMRQVA